MKRNRVRAVGARERAVGARESEVERREATSQTREAAVREREELARVREEMLRLREEAGRARADRERVLAQMREANQSLVLATVRSQELAEEAESARRQMAASEERFRSLVTTSAAIVFRADAQGRIRVDPQPWRNFTGLRVDDHGLQPEWGWLEAVHPDDREELRAAWRGALAEPSMFTHQHRLRRGDGSHAWVVTRAVPIPSEGPAREWLGMMTDISDRIRVEEAREHFIAILGHDLRNPLGAILVSVDLLRRADLPSPAADTVARIARSAERIEAMIRDVLDFARGRLGGGIPIRRRLCDLGRIAAESVSEMRQANPQRRITLDSSVGLEGPWDPDRLEQVLSNLIGNAIHHGADPIEIVAREDGDDVILSVHNEGAPIPPADVARLFEPFRRDTKARTQGLGLGLYIVSEVVRAHGGTISVSSAEHEGTTFAVRLPRRPPAAAQASDPSGDAEERHPI